MPLVQKLFSFEKFSLFFGERFGNLEFFLKKKYIYIYIYIHEQSTSNATWNFWIQKNIETWNKQTLNLTMMLQTKCRVRQSWATCFFLVHLGYAWGLMCLNLNYDEMAWACTWKAWTIWSFGICLKWLDLTLGRHVSCELLAFDVDHANTPLIGSSIGLRMIQETIFDFHTK